MVNTASTMTVDFIHSKTVRKFSLLDAIMELGVKVILEKENFVFKFHILCVLPFCIVCDVILFFFIL